MICNSLILLLYVFNDKIFYLFIYMICSREKVLSIVYINVRYMLEIREKLLGILQV